MEQILDTLLMELHTSDPDIRMFLSSFGRFEAYEKYTRWCIGFMNEISDEFFDIKEEAKMLTRETEETFGAYFFESEDIWK